MTAVQQKCIICGVTQSQEINTSSESLWSMETLPFHYVQEDQCVVILKSLMSFIILHSGQTTASLNFYSHSLISMTIIKMIMNQVG